MTEPEFIEYDELRRQLVHRGHFYENRGGRMHCVFCRVNYTAVPKDDSICEFDAARRIIDLFTDAFRLEAPFMDMIKMRVRIWRVLELYVLYERIRHGEMDVKLPSHREFDKTHGIE